MAVGSSFGECVVDIEEELRSLQQTSGQPPASFAEEELRSFQGPPPLGTIADDQGIPIGIPPPATAAAEAAPTALPPAAKRGGAPSSARAGSAGSAAASSSASDELDELRRQIAELEDELGLG